MLQAASAGEYAKHKTKPEQPEFATPGTCPPGWRPATPPLNPALGCLPNSVYFSPPSNGVIVVPPGKCPGGWKPVTPPLNPMLICLPTVFTGAPAGPRVGRIQPGCPDGWIQPKNQAVG